MNLGSLKGILLAIIGLAYVGIGYLVIDKKWFLTKVNDNTAWILGSLLILYGVFRFFRALKTIKEGSQM